MSTQRLMRALIPIVGPEIRDKIWLIRYTPIDKAQSDFFRLFTDWYELLASLSLSPEEQHPAWQHPFEIFQIDFERSEVVEVSTEVLNLIESMRRLEYDRSNEESNNDRAD